MVHDGTGRPGGAGIETVLADRRNGGQGSVQGSAPGSGQGSGHGSGHGSGRRVLVVEDDPSIAEAIRFILRRDGWAVEILDNGTEALARIPVALPDLVVLDIMLPGQSGLDVFQALRLAPATVRLPVVLLSARGQSVARDLAGDGGASIFIAKPFANADLLAAVRQLVGV